MTDRLFACTLAILTCCAFLLTACRTTDDDTAQPGDARTAKSPPFSFATGDVRLSGPYQHENLTVFLVHAQSSDEREFLTLDEGIEKKLVIVSEKDDAQVRELQIENRSDRPLYLQEGDRVIGGKQDRIILASLVIPPNSGSQPLTTFCVEASRWTMNQRTGSNFVNPTNPATAPKGVRYMAKIAADQGEVWGKVAETNTNTASKMNFNLQSSSLRESLDATPLIKASDDYLQKLEPTLAEHPDAVGVVFAVNGQIEEVNIYPGHKLFAKVYPRLLRAYASDAAIRHDDKLERKTLSQSDVRTFLTREDIKSRESRQINDGNRMELLMHSDGAARASTYYDNHLLHFQILRHEPSASNAPSSPDEQIRRHVEYENWWEQPFDSDSNDNSQSNP